MSNKIKRPKTIVTLGPATNTFEIITMIKSKGVDFVRINMSHSNIEDLNYYITQAKKINIPFIIDTEGSQIRTGNLSSKSITYNESDTIRLYKNKIIGDSTGFSLSPGKIVDQLEEGDILYIDFDTLVLRISDISSKYNGFIDAIVISSGSLGNNKGVVIDPRFERKFDIPMLTEKDIEAIKIGLNEKISHVAASFMRSGETVKAVRNISKNKMKIISKIECKDALKNIDDIIKESDFLLIDRGDLSKEISIEKIPFIQRIIIEKARRANKGTYIATNLLESMIINRKPTRAEVHDIVDTILEGAYGLTLAAETAIGKYPIGCINMLNKIISHSMLIMDLDKIKHEKIFVQNQNTNKYLQDEIISSSIVQPHGGKLINKVSNNQLDDNYIKSLKQLRLNKNQHLDFEQISIGAYSPLEGFMTKLELDAVLDKLHLPNGTIWPMPIVLDITLEDSKKINEGDTIALLNESNEFIGTIQVIDKYQYDKKILARKFFGHNNPKHPGVKSFGSLNPIFIGGEITLYKMRCSSLQQLMLTPQQTRKLFEEKNWTKVVGFHTRNVIHRAHECIQMQALIKGNCDGIFLHPVVGKKKSKDYTSDIIVKSYELMQKQFYPDDKTVFGVFSTYSRYGDQKEALFTALCRKNYGCSHFIIGRDHTGTGVNSFSNNQDQGDIFDQYPNIGIEIIKFNNVYYSKSKKKYIEENEIELISKDGDKMSISGTEARELLSRGEEPPSWFMRTEISKMIIKEIKENKDVFIN